MARNVYSAEQQRIEREIARLQKRSEALQQKQRAPAIAQIVRTMKEYSITPEEIAAVFSKKKPAKAAPRKASATAGAPKRSVPPKYRHPDTGDTWTGRGKPPRWVSDAEQAGTPRTQFLIENA